MISHGTCGIREGVIDYLLAMLAVLQIYFCSKCLVAAEIVRPRHEVVWLEYSKMGLAPLSFSCHCCDFKSVSYFHIRVSQTCPSGALWYGGCEFRSPPVLISKEGVLYPVFGDMLRSFYIL